MPVESSPNETYENGDLFDGDNGDYYARISSGAGDDITSPPANFSLYYNGFWYNYKMDSREDAIRAIDPAELQKLNEVDEIDKED